VVGEEMCLNATGQVVIDEWRLSADIRAEIRLDSFVVMPNHLHGIVFIEGSLFEKAVLERIPGPGKRSLSSMVVGFKGAVTKAVRVMTGNHELAVWQDGFHDHIIRNEQELEAIREYIWDNPRAWSEDPQNPERIGEPPYEREPP
jgi:REP element-mobilizing transposase RayT